MAFGGKSFGGGMFADSDTLAAPIIYGTGFITDYAREPGSTITDRSNAASGTASDYPSVTGGSSITDRSSG